jgi:hypothetical protein
LEERLGTVEVAYLIPDSKKTLQKRNLIALFTEVVYRPGGNYAVQDKLIEL